MLTLRSLRAGGLVALFVAPALLAACGGGGDEDADSNGASGPATDEAYVAAMCEAYDDFADTFAKLMTERLTDPDSQPDTQKEALKIYIEPFEQLVAGMEKANPPKDMKKYHAETVKQLKSTLKKVKDGNASAFGELGNANLPEPPADVKERLEKAVQANRTCRDASFSFD